MMEDSILECKICYFEFDHNTRKPITMKCGHYSCETCLQALLNQNPEGRKCPMCDNRIDEN